jgi:hypothetical protein
MTENPGRLSGLERQLFMPTGGDSYLFRVLHG